MSTKKTHGRARIGGRVTPPKHRTFARPKRTIAAASFLATGALCFAMAATPSGAATAPSTSQQSSGSTTTTTAPATSSTTSTPSTTTTTPATAPVTATPPAASQPSSQVPKMAATTTLTSLPPTKQAYWLATSNGTVYAFGGAPKYGTASKDHPPRPIVGMAATRTGGGYWLVTSDGAVYAFGNAVYRGGENGHPLRKPIVGIAADAATGGYWLVAADGGIFSFGAPYLGSKGGQPLYRPVVGMAAMPTGAGYWEVASDGGVFSYGTAHYLGGRGGHPLRAPIVGMETDRTGHGYRLVGADGGVFSYGNSLFYHSLGGRVLPYPVTAIAAMYSDKGYWLTTSQGGVTPFGTARLFGVAPAPVAGRVVAMAPATGNGDPVAPSYPPGSYGYDVSNYQCGNFPPGGHTIGIVEIDGWGNSDTNPCFVTEVNWAGPGLDLYMFMVYGTSSTAEPGCSGTPDPAACNYGYITANSDFATAGSMINGRATVPWWLDIEQGNWSSNKANNASVVMGAVNALHADGVATVGFYFSLEGWTTWMGTYDPTGPLFPAWWGGPAPATKCKEARSVAASSGHFIPSGPIALIQYTDNAGGFDGDYSC
jgi:hypothetical protein